MRSAELGRACPLCPGLSDVNLFRNRKCIVHFDTEVSDCALDFSVTKQQLDGSEITGSPIDQRRLGPAKRAGAKEFRVQPDAGDPSRDQPCILAGGHRPLGTTAVEQEVADRPICGPEIDVDRFAGLVCQLELYRSTSFLLPNRRAVDGISIWCNILHFKGDDIATSKLAIDGQIEHG